MYRLHLNLDSKLNCEKFMDNWGDLNTWIFGYKELLDIW